MSTGKSGYELYYFPARVRGEVCRLAFAAAKIEYEDIRLKGDDWVKLKAYLHVRCSAENYSFRDDGVVKSCPSEYMTEQRPDTVTVEDMKELRYLECVIKEAQRLFPSVSFLARTASEDFYLDGGYITPKGTTVGVATIALHRNPEVWPAPLEFDPDRFLPENSQGRHPLAFIPFSAGPRNCIGQRFALLEEKIVLSHVLRNFDVESTQTFDDLRTSAELVTRPKEGICVTLKKWQ